MALSSLPNSESTDQNVLFFQENILKKSQACLEPSWLTEFRLQSLENFVECPKPPKAPIKQTYKALQKHFSENPIKQTSQKSESQEVLSGNGSLKQSDAVYQHLVSQWLEQGVIFCSLHQALQEHPQLVQKYLGKAITEHDVIAMLNNIAWSQGTFLYVPENVVIETPLQPYFHIKTATVPFQRTLIVLEQNAKVNYVEGCTAPTYTSTEVHANVIEIFAAPNSQIQYTAIQNWSSHISSYGLQQAVVEKNAKVEWIDINLGSKHTQKSISCQLQGTNAQGSISCFALVDEQNWEMTNQIHHRAANTLSEIHLKSIHLASGKFDYHSEATTIPQISHAVSQIQNQSLLISPDACCQVTSSPRINHSNMKIQEQTQIATLDPQTVFYLRSRGISFKEAQAILINSFISSVLEKLPMEYAIELQRIVELKMDGAIG